jgi:hypothetical protein
MDLFIKKKIGELIGAAKLRVLASCKTTKKPALRRGQALKKAS